MSTLRTSTALAAVCASSAALADVPSVAVDIAPVHSLVARVMQGVGEPELVVQIGASPHGYSLRPSEAAALQDADMVIWIGEDLTPWMENAVETLASDAKVLTLLEAEGTTRLEFRESALFEAHDHDHGEHDGHDHGEKHAHDDHDHGEDHAHDDHDHDHGEDHAHDDHGHDHGEDHAHDDHGHDHGEDHAHDDHGHEHGEDHAHENHAHAHGAHDPHAWLSPDNAKVWVSLIAAELAEVDPDNAAAYTANADAARAELTALEGEIDSMLDDARGKSFVVFHDAYQYFETAFDFPASGAISLSDASDPSPARIAEIQARVRDESITCVLSEPQFNPSMVQTVLDGTEAKTAVLDPLGSNLDPGPGLYPQMLRNLAGALAECL